MAKMPPPPHPIPSNSPPNQYHSTIVQPQPHPRRSHTEIPIRFRCLHDALLPPPSHQRNRYDPSTIRAPIRLHPSPDTHQSRPSNPTNVSRNVWHEAAQEYGLHRCLPAHILLVRLCHHRRDWVGPFEVTERNKTPQKDCGNHSISKCEC
jgi:hypothetical protein